MARLFGNKRRGLAGDSKYGKEYLMARGTKAPLAKGCRLITFKKKNGGRTQPIMRCDKNVGSLSRKAKARKKAGAVCWNAKGLFTKCSNKGARKKHPKSK